MADTLLIIRIRRLDCFAAVKPFDDLRDIQSGFHIKIGERPVRVVKASGIILFQQIDHLFHHPARGKDLIGLLRRDIIENILIMRFIKIIGKLVLLFQEFGNGIVKYDLIEEMPRKMLRFPVSGSV